MRTVRGANDPPIRDRTERIDLTPFVDPQSITLVAESGVDGSPGALDVETSLLEGGYRCPFHRVDVAVADGPPMRLPSGDLALIAVSPALVDRSVATCAESGYRGVIVLNGPAGDVDAEASVRSSLVEAARGAFRVLGPNSQGVLSLPSRVFAGTGSLLRATDLRSGSVAVATQSGFGHACVSVGEAAGLGFSHVISSGNEGDLDVIDVAGGLLGRDEVEVVWVIAEGIRRGRALVELGRLAAGAGKAVLVWKAGRSVVAQRAAASHTGALALDARVVSAALRSAGLIEVHGEDDLVDATRAVLGRRLARGRGVGVLTVSGGAGVALADCLTDADLAVPALAARTVAELVTILGSRRAITDPLDVGRSITRDRRAYEAAIRVVARDPSVHQVILCHGGIEGSGAIGLAEAARAASRGRRTPISVVWAPRLGRADDALAILAGAGIPVFSSVHRAARAAAVLAEVGGAASRDRGRGRMSDGEATRAAGPAPLEIGEDVVGERVAKRHLAAYGIRVVVELQLPIEDRHVVPPVKWPLRFPVVVKVDTTGIKSRATAGLVRTGVEDRASLLRVAGRLVRRARDLGVDVGHVLVQEQLSGPEAYIGAFVDPRFGPLVAVGLGGSAIERVGRPTFALAPLARTSAREIVDRSELGPILGPREARAVADALARLSWLIADHADRIESIDVNPLFVSSSGAVAADALIVAAGTR